MHEFPLILKAKRGENHNAKVIAKILKLNGKMN